MLVFDASSMIYAWDNYPVNQFPPFWQWIATQVEQRALVMPKWLLKRLSIRLQIVLNG